MSALRGCALYAFGDLGDGVIHLHHIQRGCNLVTGFHQTPAFSQHLASFTCESVRLDPPPATSHTVALFLAAEAKLRRAPSTLARRLGAKLPSPHDALEVAEVLRGIRRRWKQPPAQKAPAVDEAIKRMVDDVEPQTLKGLRDRALLLLGFAGAFRRSELVALDTDHLIERDEGFAVRIATSKTDQEGQARWLRFPASRARPTARYAPSPTGSSWRGSPRG